MFEFERRLDSHFLSRTRRRILVNPRPTSAKFVRITQTGTATAGEFWAIQQLRLYQMPTGTAR